MKALPLTRTPLEQLANPYAGFRNQRDDFAVALVHPFLAQAARKNRLKYRESLALGYLAGSLEHHDFPTVSINAELLTLEPAGVAERLLADPRIALVGISSKSQRTYRAAKEIARILKASRPGVHVTIGGVFPTAADVHVLDDCPSIDSVVRGEGEYAIVELAARLQQGAGLDGMLGITWRDGGETRRAPDRPRVRDIDALPFPARHDLEHILATGARGGSSAYLVASRGCYAACTFCSIHQIYGDHNVVRRSPQSICDEMESLQRRYGIRRFSFVDDLFIMPSRSGVKWVHEFCDEIFARGLDVNFYAEMRADTIEVPLVRKLVRAGLHRLFIGMEAGVDSVLQRWDKGTTVADNDRAIERLHAGVGMPVHAINFGYIMFDPEMTYDELKGQYRWVRDSGFAKVQHLQNKMNIYWGTPQYERMTARGIADPTPLGDRWEYEFDDRRVGSFEQALRRFHRRYEEEWSDPVIDAKEAFLEHVHEDSTPLPLPPWALDVLSQALRRLEESERACYYHAFESQFAHLDTAEELTPEVEERIWTDLLPALERLRAEAYVFHELARTADVLVVADAGAGGLQPPGSARHTGGERPTACVRLRALDGRYGVRAVTGFTGRDRYAHACEVVRFDDERGTVEVVADAEMPALARQWRDAALLVQG